MRLYPEKTPRYSRAVMETLARASVSMTEAEVFQLERKRAQLAPTTRNTLSPPLAQ